MSDGKRSSANNTSAYPGTYKPAADYRSHLIQVPQGSRRTSTILNTGVTAVKPTALPSHTEQPRVTKPSSFSQVTPKGQTSSQPGTRTYDPAHAKGVETSYGRGEYPGTSSVSMAREPAYRATPDYTSDTRTNGMTSLPRDPSARSQATLNPRDSNSRQQDKSALITAGSTTISSTSTASIPRSRERVGLRNLGNTCFMNSILQCVAHTPGFIDSLLSSLRTDINRHSKLRGQLAERFAELMEEMRNSRTAVSPDQVKHMVGRFAPQFSGYMQQDAHEFLRFLLDGLHEDLNRIQRKQPYKELEGGGTDYARVASEWFQYHKNRDDSVVTDYFRGQLLSIITCSRCNSRSLACDTFLDLSVPVPARAASVKLQQCFSTFTAETEVEEYKCEKCKKIVHGRMELTIWKFPVILVIQLKRFATSSWRREKIDTDVVFPVKGFDLREYAPHSSDPSTRSPVYKLFGVSHHMGNLGFGHYVA